MSALEILPDLFFIERGYLSGNFFVYRGPQPVLIDTAYITEFEKTERQVRELGIDLDEVRLIVNTHTHCDHVGGNRRIQERSGCEIALHRVGRHFIESRDGWSTWWRYYDQQADFFTPTRGLVDGEMLSIGPYQFTVVYTPGHAADGIVLYNREASLLISSDTLWENDMGVMTLRVEGSRALWIMQESLRKIAGLDVRSVYPGHGSPFSGYQAAIQRAQQRLETFIDNRSRLGNDVLKKIIVYTLLMRGRAEEQDFFDQLMATIWFPETVELYFDGAYREKYQEICKSLLQRGVMVRQDGYLFTTVKP